jgi:nucleoid-associated protein YgaU
MKNPFASPKKTGRTDQNPTGDNIAGVDHLEYGGHLPNSTSYDSALEVMAYSGPHDVKDPYASQHIDTNFSRTGSPRVSRANTREDPDRLDPADAVDALPADDGDKPEESACTGLQSHELEGMLQDFDSAISLE